MECYHSAMLLDQQWFNYMASLSITSHRILDVITYPTIMSGELGYQKRHQTMISFYRALLLVFNGDFNQYSTVRLLIFHVLYSINNSNISCIFYSQVISTILLFFAHVGIKQVRHMKPTSRKMRATFTIEGVGQPDYVVFIRTIPVNIKHNVWILTKVPCWFGNN